MKETYESQHILFGPYASLNTSNQIEWIQFVMDRAGDIEQFKTANPAQFVRNEWQTDKPILDKISVYCPGVEKSECCFVFASKQVIRFYFSPKGAPWPGEPFRDGLFRNASIRPINQNVTSRDWWHPLEDKLIDIRQQYRDWQQGLQAASSEATWHEGQDIKSLDFMYDDQGHKKSLIQTVLSPTQVMNIQQLIQDDWSQLKAVSKHSTDYCQALQLLLLPTLLPEHLTGLSPEIADKVVNLQKWSLPTVINKFPVSRFYAPNQPNISIDDIRHYLHDLVIAEITQYTPEQVLPRFKSDETIKTTKIGAMQDDMGQLLFQLTEAMSEESQEQVLQLRQLMLGNANDLTEIQIENLLRIITDIEHRQINPQAQAIESNLVAIHAALGHTEFGQALGQIKMRLIELSARFWIKAFASERCPQLDVSKFDNDMSLLVAIYQRLVTEHTPQSEQDAILAKIIEHTHYLFLTPWKDDTLLKVVLSKSKSLTREPYSSVLEHALSSYRLSGMEDHNRLYLGQLIKDMSLEKSKVIIEKVRALAPHHFRPSEIGILRFNLELGLTQAQRNVILEAWDIYNWPVESGYNAAILMGAYPDSRKEQFYAQHKALIDNDSNVNIDTFLAFMAVLPEQHKESFYNQNKHVVENITNSFALRKSFETLPEVYRERYLRVMMPRIASMISRYNITGGCEDILEYLSIEQRNVVWQEIKSIVIEGLKKEWRSGSTGTDLRFLTYLTEAQGMECLKSLESIRFSSVGCGMFGTQLSQIPEETVRMVCDTWKQGIVKIMDSAGAISLLFRNSVRPDCCHTLYDIFKDTIASKLQSEEDYHRLQQYLTPEEQIDLSHRITLFKLQTWLPTSRLETFKSALMSDESTLKEAFDALLEPKYTVKSFFRSNKQTNANLIQTLACAEIGWLRKLNMSLSLWLTDEELTDRSAVKTALEEYVATDGNMEQEEPPSV